MRNGRASQFGTRTARVTHEAAVVIAVGQAPSGPTPTPTPSDASPPPNPDTRGSSKIGTMAAQAGDVNGDGYSDLYSSGRVYRGGAAGLSTVPAVVLTGP